jgi:hypothetical protein
VVIEVCQRQNVLTLVYAGIPPRIISTRLHIDPASIRRIISQKKERDDAREKGGLRGFLSPRAVNVIAGLTGCRPPMLIDLRTWIRDHRDWKCRILTADNCGIKTSAEIIGFIEHRGVFTIS